MDQLDELLTCKILSAKVSNLDDGIIEGMLSDNPSEVAGVEIKNLCVKVTKSFSDEVDEVCGLLSISKRRFMIAALNNAISRFHELADNHEFWEAVKPPKIEMPVDLGGK